jgi:small neutral amino acid transporter SnatA (MarC family)
MTIVVDPFTATVATATVTSGRTRPERTRAVLVAAVVAGTALTVCAVVADPVLDALDVSAPSALLAAGMVVAVAALWLLAAGSGARVRDATSATGARLGVFPLGVPMLVHPAALSAVVAWSAARGPGVTTAAAFTAVAVYLVVALALRAPVPAWVARVGGMFAGAALAVVAFDLVRDGVFGT